MNDSQNLKRKNILQAAIFSITIIAIVLILLILFNNFFATKKQKINSNAINDDDLQTNFPLTNNVFDMNSFICIVTDLEYLEKDIKETDTTILVAAGCDYLDKKGNSHSIKVPLISKNSTNHLVSTQLFNSDEFFNWTVDNYMGQISKMYYLGNINQDRYDDPYVKNYIVDKRAKKPEISAGDRLSISFAMGDSTIFDNQVHSNSAQFFSNYHRDVIGYDKISNFIKDGNPKGMLTKDNFLIPTWVTFTEDRDYE